ncbi:MAG: hypothetical protein II650_05275, partial [Clostridia bacterium]|nr:hypothetical protein [Clostridia bacterium]
VLPPRPLGAVIDKRPAPEASCPPAAQAKKTMDLQDPKSASASAQDTKKHLPSLSASRAGEKSVGSARSIIRKRQRANKMNDQKKKRHSRNEKAHMTGKTCAPFAYIPSFPRRYCPV